MLSRPERDRDVRPQPDPTRARRGSLALALLTATVLAVGAAPASAAIPANYLTVSDQEGANDINSAQSDLTQLGRDDSDTNVYKLFWSWDSTDQWTGSGNTGTACALFDSNGNGFIDFAVCGEILNDGANPAKVVQSASSPIAVSCGDDKKDRCSNPSAPIAHTLTQLQAGVLTAGLPGTSPPGDLVTNTDPFGPLVAGGPGSNYPNDSTLEVVVRKDFLPAGAVLANVCSYSSLGSGGNANPFDCIIFPGAGLLVIKKLAGTDTTTSFPFTVSPVPSGTSANYSVVGGGQTAPIGVAITNSESVTETVPTDWNLSAASCTKADGSATGTFSAANHNVTGIAIESAKVTTCTFTDVKKPTTAVTKDNNANPDATNSDTEDVPGNAS
jgi:hypothetical protein